MMKNVQGVVMPKAIETFWISVKFNTYTYFAIRVSEKWKNKYMYNTYFGQNKCSWFFIFFNTYQDGGRGKRSHAASPTLTVAGRFRCSLHDNKILFEIGRLFFCLNIILCQLNLIRIPPGIQLPSLITFHALLKPIC